MKHSEKFALGQWLTWYADSMTYKEIIDAMRDDENIDGCEDFDVFGVVENLPLDYVADLIENTKFCFEHSIKEMGLV